MPITASFTAIKVKEQQLFPDKMIAQLILGTERATDHILKKLQEYPPPTGGPYRRTYRLRRGWKKKRIDSGGSVKIQIYNNVSYVRRVQGRPEDEPGQAEIHQGRWTPARDIVEKERPLFYAALERYKQKHNGVVGG